MDHISMCREFNSPLSTLRVFDHFRYPFYLYAILSAICFKIIELQSLLWFVSREIDGISLLFISRLHGKSKQFPLIRILP